MRGRRSADFPGIRAGIAPGWRLLLTASERSLGTLQPIVRTPSNSQQQCEPRSESLARVEAALFAADEPMTPRRLARLAELPDTGEARRSITRLNELYERDGSAFYIEEVAGGYQMLTRPELRPWLDHLAQGRDELQLSGPTLETLAIVAYRQPICRADIEAIRGVQVGELLKQIMDKGLIRFSGRDDSLGRPFLYGTTKRFLQVFGLRNLHELPLVELFSRPGSAATSDAETNDVATAPSPEPTEIVEDEDEA